MAASEIHIGDIGTEFRITITEDSGIVDLSSSTNITITFSRPDGTINSVSAGFYTDGTDGIISYQSIEGDLTVAGMYKIQAKVEFSSQMYYSSIQTFRVYPNLG
jgi:hypothetical protein